MENNLTCDQQRGEYVSGNIFLRPVNLAFKGHRVEGHKHNFDHTTFIVKGSVNVVATCDDGCRKEQDFKAGDHFLVNKNWQHAITALENDVMFFCIYSHRDPQGEVIQENTGWKSDVKAYN